MGASCSPPGSFSERPERCIYKLLTKRPRKSIARFSGNRFSKPFLLLFGFFGEQSSVLKLLKFIPVRYLKFSTWRTGSAMPGGPVLHRLQYCSFTAVVQAVVQLYSLCMDRTVPVLMYLKFSRYRTRILNLVFSKSTTSKFLRVAGINGERVNCFSNLFNFPFIKTYFS